MASNLTFTLADAERRAFIQETFESFDESYRFHQEFVASNPTWVENVEQFTRDNKSLMELNRFLQDLLLNNTNVRVVVPESTLLRIVVEFTDSTGETKRDCIVNDIHNDSYYGYRMILIEKYEIPGFEELPDFVIEN
jgi:hypothetical protein